jgi:hypothetical protein
VSAGGGQCALSANLENTEEEVTLTDVTEPGVTRGNGVFRGTAPGRNGTDLFFQVSN